MARRTSRFTCCFCVVMVLGAISSITLIVLLGIGVSQAPSMIEKASNAVLDMLNDYAENTLLPMIGDYVVARIRPELKSLGMESATHALVQSRRTTRTGGAANLI